MKKTIFVIIHTVDAMRKTARIRLFFLLVLLPVLCQGEGSTSFFRRYVSNVRPAEYGGESQIWAIENDGHGFLYLATGTSLTVFDGYVYDNYTIDGYSVIRDLRYDPSTGRLYCAGDNFFGYWVMNASGEMVFTCLYSNRDFSRNEIFWRIFPRGEKLYLQTHEAVYVHDFQRLKLLESGDVGYLFQTGGDLYAQIDSRICRLDGERFNCISEALDDRIVLLERGPEDSFLILGETSGFARLVPGRDGLGRREEIFPQTNRVLSGLKVFSAIARRSGGWMVGTVLDGAYLIDGDGTLSESFNSHAGLDYTTVLSLHEDSAGNLTLGADGGLAQVRNNGGGKFYYTLSGKIGYVYASILWNGDLYIGTNKGLFKVKAGSDDGKPEMIAGTQGQIWDIHRCGEELIVVEDRGICSLDREGNHTVLLPSGWKLVPVPGRKGLYCASDARGLMLMGLNEEGRLRPLRRLKQYDNPDNSVFFDKYGYAWVEQLKGSIKRLTFDMEYTEVRESRIYRVGRDPKRTIRAFAIDGEVLFTSGNECYGYSPHADSLVLSRYYTEMFSAFGTPELNLFQHGNFFFNYVGNTVDAIVRTGNEIRIVRDLFSSSGIDHLPQRFRRVFSWDERTVACGFSECIGIIGIGRGTPGVQPEVTLYRLHCSCRGKGRVIPLDGEVVLPYGATDLEFRICAMPRASLDYRFDNGVWQQVPNAGPLTVKYLESGSHMLELRFGNEIVLSQPFFIKRHPIWQGWSPALLFLALILLFLGGRQLYRLRMRKLRRQFETRQKMLIEKEQICHQNEMLSLELKERDKKLSILALNDITVNNMLRDILDELEAATTSANRNELKKVHRCIEGYMRDNGTWNNFEQYFNGIFDGFFDRLLARYPKLTNNDMKICAYVKLGMNTKEMASLMNIEISSAESARYRLRKNMGLTQNDSLTEIISKI